MEPVPARTHPVVIVATALFIAPFLVLLAQASTVGGIAAIGAILALCVFAGRIDN